MSVDVYGGEYRQRDQVVEEYESFEDGIEVRCRAKALEKYPWIRSGRMGVSPIGEKYMWKAMSPEKDDITRAVAENDKTVEDYVARDA